MADEWYFMKNGRKIGPLSSKSIVDLAASGKLLPTDSIQKKGATTWQEASAVKGLFPQAPAALETTIAELQAEPPADAMPPCEQSMPPRPPAIPLAASDGAVAPLSIRKYKHLDWYIASSRSIARIVFALVAMTGLYPLLLAFLGQKSDGILTGPVFTLFAFPFTFLVGYLLYMVQMAGADFLSAIRDIEENTRIRSSPADELK